jgi:hypothetical protein
MPERRRNPRVQLALPCTLCRRSGSAIAAETVDVGPGGMCVSASRPLRTDELLSFAIAPGDGNVPISGRARVLRPQAYGVYALRFERLPAPVGERIRDLAAVPAR